MRRESLGSQAAGSRSAPTMKPATIEVPAAREAALFPLRDINPARITPFVTLAIVAVNVAVFFLVQPSTGTVEEVEFLYERAAVACELTTGQPISFEELESGSCNEAGVPIFPEKNILLAGLVTMFLHGNLLHLAGNMWFLWIFGNNVEEAYGRFGYAVMYLLAGIAGTAAFVLVRPEDVTPMVGASGAIAGVLGAYFVLYPRHLVVSVVFFYLVPVPAVIFLGLWFVGQFLVTDAGVAWEAHAAGFAFGALVSLPFRSLLLRHDRRVRREHGD